MSEIPQAILSPEENETIPENIRRKILEGWEIFGLLDQNFYMSNGYILGEEENTKAYRSLMGENEKLPILLQSGGIGFVTKVVPQGLKQCGFVSGELQGDHESAETVDGKWIVLHRTTKPVDKQTDFVLKNVQEVVAQ